MTVEGAIKQIEDMMGELSCEIADLNRRLGALAIAAVFLRRSGKDALTAAITQVHAPLHDRELGS